MYSREKLKELSEIIKSECKSLMQTSDDLAKDLFKRSGRLWYTYFSQGTCLSHGGVAEPFFAMTDYYGMPTLQTFNLYRSEKESVQITQHASKQFLIEEQAIKVETSIEDLAVSFCLGSHEGLMRVARCIYRQDYNEEMVFAVGSYGLIAGYLATMEPVSYKLRFVDIDRENGEKIRINQIESVFQNFIKAKTLFLELKTTAGYVYKDEEIIRIIELCKKHNIFFIADATHINMNYRSENAFCDVAGLCQKNDFHNFTVLYTASKTYGMERARVGFIVMSKHMTTSSFDIIENDLHSVLGSVFDLPFVVGNILINSSIENRREYSLTSASRHRFNMNLMLAYIEGIQSIAVDSDIKELVVNEVGDQYAGGIKGLKIIYKPVCGTHMKVDTSGLKNKFFTNIRMFNAEMFCYSLNKIANVVTLHSYCIMDPCGYSMRLSFAIKADVHKGLRAMHDFVNLLTDFPTPNEYITDVQIVEDLIFDNSSTDKLSSHLAKVSMFSTRNRRVPLASDCEELSSPSLKTFSSRQP